MTDRFIETARELGYEGDLDDLASRVRREIRRRRRRASRPVKRCYRCHRTLPALEFAEDGTKSGGLKAVCKKCDAEHKRKTR